jgi:HlyD family secretion protein
MLERFKGMSPDEQKQFLDRIKGRGGDTSAFEKAMAPAAKGKGGAAPAAASATTIDALFAPLPVIERPGRAWMYVEKQLKAVNFRTGITDGTNTEVTSGDLQPGTELVTGIVLPTAQRAAAGATGNPLLGQQGNRGGNFGGGGFPGGGRGR